MKVACESRILPARLSWLGALLLAGYSQATCALPLRQAGSGLQCRSGRRRSRAEATTAEAAGAEWRWVRSPPHPGYWLALPAYWLALPACTYHARQLRRLHAVEPLAFERGGHRDAPWATNALCEPARAHWPSVHTAPPPPGPAPQAPLARSYHDAATSSAVLWYVPVPRSRRRWHPLLARPVRSPPAPPELFVSHRTVAQQPGRHTIARAQHVLTRLGRVYSGHGSVTISCWTDRCAPPIRAFACPPRPRRACSLTRSLLMLDQQQPPAQQAA
jgi:hypothetical protein